MVSRVPHLGEDSTNLSQGIGPQAQTQIRDGKGQGQGHGTPRQPKKEAGTPKPAQDVAELKDYKIGDCLGKGAFGSVYRALNMGTGETVAVKQVKLADLPKSEIRVITLEIDLLKNLDHPNIVKYRGFVKSAESLNIILEYCENGSLHSISKNFGKFPENLVGLYMSQVLHGLLYLHEQGVIHRDIKGANILTTKQGLVKLADFGVATRTTTLHESSVVGTPYWMAPEVIELSGATTASDIWSLGCTVIELLDGKPPYHKLQPMHALFRIVNDDHPPLPEGASPVVRDFLMQCFQKDPNLRVSARKLLKHPWIVNARRSDSVVPKKPTEYEEAVKSVQQWNEALKSPNPGSLKRASRPTSSSPIPGRREPPTPHVTPGKGPLSLAKPRTIAEQFRSPDNTADDNWDNDFDSAPSPSALQRPRLRPQDNFGGLLSSERLKAYASFETVTEESNWDDNFEGDLTMKSPLQLANSDPLQTIRAHYHRRAGSNETKVAAPTNLLDSKPPRVVTDPRTEAFLPPGQKHATPAATAPGFAASLYTEDSDEDYSDLVAANEGAFESSLLKADTISPRLFHPSDLKNSLRLMQSPRPGGSLRRQPVSARQPSMRRTRSSVEIQRYAEDEHDEDFSDVFGKPLAVVDKADSERGSDGGTLMLTSKLSNHSWLGDEDDDDDPFAQLEEGFDETDLEANVARDKYARLCTQVEGLVSSLKISQAEETLADLSEQLLDILSDLPETKNVIISAHGMLPILEILETCRRRDVIFHLLKIVNMIIFSEVEIQENLCFVGGIPIITKFASKKYPSEIRLEAAAFVRQMFQTSTLTLQMFVSAGGLKVLVEFLEEDYEEERDLVLIGVNGVWSVFELQGPTPKNDFCRILSRNSVLDPLSLVLSRVLDEDGALAELCEGRIANIFFFFSQAENYVKEIVADRTVLHRVLKELRRMSPTHQITMLKFIKNLSMLSTTLDSLQNSNAIDVLTELLRTSMKESHFREISNQVLNTIYNMCRLNKLRQEDAALNGIIPILLRILKTERPLKEFALPILCDMAHSGKVGRRELWRNKGLPFYISLLADPYWQVTALDAIFIWLQEETAKVEEHLLDGSFTDAIIKCFTTSKANAFENLLEPLQKLLRLSPPVALSLANAELFRRILQKLQSNKAVVRLNLLRIIRSICDASDEQGGLISQYGLVDAIQRLAEVDGAVLVRNMAGELIRSSEANDKLGISTGSSKRRTARRASSASTPPGMMHSLSMPPTPTSSRSSHSKNYFGGERENRQQRSAINGSTPFRPTSRDGSGGLNGTPGLSNGAGSVAKSRLPRTTAGRTSRQAMPPLSRTGGEENITPTAERHGAPLIATPNPRRRRQVSGDSRWP
ncbi:cell division control protein 15 cdc15 [Lasallia pustulata]|uniref:Cytokinesis protein sepH n=1 Tax=Lasallia pustulata TaxID=136370 RepID=A0A1W5DCW8_9LECA|nr:cell division control protein 15 cdc15 [Lasallia pustulata]